MIYLERDILYCLNLFYLASFFFFFFFLTNIEKHYRYMETYVFLIFGDLSIYISLFPVHSYYSLKKLLHIIE